MTRYGSLITRGLATIIAMSSLGTVLIVVTELLIHYGLHMCIRRKRDGRGDTPQYPMAAGRPAQGPRRRSTGVLARDVR